VTIKLTGRPDHPKGKPPGMTRPQGQEKNKDEESYTLGGSSPKGSNLFIGILANNL